MPEPDPIFFPDAAAFRAWLQEHHDSRTEVWVGMWRVKTGVPSPRWADLVPEALCFGWIDGKGKGIDDERIMQRFTPRRSRRWSAVNVRHVERLTAAGLMHPAGIAAFEARDPDLVPYSTSDRPDQLEPAQDAVLRAHAKAAAYWDTLPPSYRKSCAFWIGEAKREATRAKRLAELLEACARGERLARFAPVRRGRTP